MNLPKRKSPRLLGYDYSENGSYFLTICTHNKELLFGPVGVESVAANVIEQAFVETLRKYPQVHAPVYKVMPNHFHAIITIERADMESAPTVSRIVQEFKRYSTLLYIRLVNEGKLAAFEGKVWQRSFHDHIIRNDREYKEIWEYIQYNHQKWEMDCFYPKENEPAE